MREIRETRKHVLRAIIRLMIEYIAWINMLASEDAYAFNRLTQKTFVVQLKENGEIKGERRTKWLSMLIELILTLLRKS